MSVNYVKHPKMGCTAGILICCILFPLDSFAQNRFSEALEAATELKQKRVVRYYDNCLTDGFSDKKCRDKLKELHERELASLQVILDGAISYNEFALSGAMTSCYRPSSDYEDLIICWEALASKVKAGEDLNQEPPDQTVDFSRMAVELFSDLTPFERKSIVLCVRGQIHVNYRDTVAQNLKKGSSDTLWALKVNSFENARMEKLSEEAHWPALYRYYKVETSNMAKLIKGEIDFSEYRSLSEKNKKLIDLAISPEMARKAEHEKNFHKYDDKCTELSNRIIGEAKILATED